MVLPIFLERYFQVSSMPRFDAVSALQGLLVGVLTVLLFTIPPLLGVRYIRPALIFRRGWPRPPLTLGEWWKRTAASVISGFLILLFVGALAAWLSDSWQTGRYFAFAVAAGLASLALVAWLLLRGLRIVSRNLPRAAGPVVRQGIANLYRPGNHAGAAVMALGVGVMFTVTVWIVQRGLLQDIVRTAPPGMPNVYLLDITASKRDAVYALLEKQKGIEGRPEMLGAVSVQMQSIDGRNVQRDRMQGFARRYARTMSVSTADRKPDFTQVVAGAWWPKGAHPAVPELSVAESAAKVLNIHVGSHDRLDHAAAQLRIARWSRSTKASRCGSARGSNSSSPRARSTVFPRFTTAACGQSRRRCREIQKNLYESFPTITVVNMAEVLDTIQSIVDQISLVVRFISFFSILAGAVILASSVAGTRFRRIREVVILKTLGATRGRIAQIFSIEFVVIGTVAGLMGGLLAGGFAWLVLNRLLHADASPDVLPMLVSVAGTALLAVATGWAASYRTLGQKPLEILREE